MEEQNYYVYQYIDENGVPYYIGKGKNRRIHQWHYRIVVPPISQRIILAEHLTDKQACDLEVEMILKYGRKKDGGLLENIRIRQWATYKGWKHTNEAKKKISEGNKGKIRTPEAIERYRLHGLNQPPEVKQKIRESLTGTKRPKEVIEKMSAAFAGKTWEEIYGIEGAMKRREDWKKRSKNHSMVN